MITDFGMTQKQAAEKLGITPAAVCQYLSKKRGGKININLIDNTIKEEIFISTKNIIKNGNGHVTVETCRICKTIRNNGKFKDFCTMCDKEK